ncbi:hypothetical protein JQ594_05265 [Bradyrhizobium manausense]|uniref:hypothetical protein n=1 Tax=Bradyrhizobium manausense TaxID=989370 RepID=UPI001BA94597|nr:hypothetical protein [Bradyrhizobium manausense]MBR0685314.1 hypothetical protein [Bradyrhizobium manausense]
MGAGTGWIVCFLAALFLGYATPSFSQSFPTPPGAKAVQRAVGQGTQAVQGAVQKGIETVQGVTQKGAEAVQTVTQKGVETIQEATQKSVEAAVQQVPKAVTRTPDISTDLLRLGGGQNFVSAGVLFPRGSSLPSCNVTLPALPRAEDIANAVKIPADDIARKVIELQTAPFTALGTAMINGVIEEWKKERNDLKREFFKRYGKKLFLFVLLVALLTSMLFGLPMRKLLLRVPTRK